MSAFQLFSICLCQRPPLHQSALYSHGKASQSRSRGADGGAPHPRMSQMLPGTTSSGARGGAKADTGRTCAFYFVADGVSRAARWPVVSGLRTEDRNRTTEDRGQRTEDRGQRTEDGGRQKKDSGFCIIFPSFLPIS
jgi:hypothetical protein